jgi:hypothetical protein
MRRLLLAFASIALIACGGSDSTGPVASAEGTWNLQTFNGEALPATYFTDPSTGDKSEILADQFVFNADGTFTEAFTTRDTEGTTVTTTPGSDSGTWSQSGSQVTVVTTSGPFTATVNNDTFTISSQVGALVYTRQ